jgi:hypothetical protein
MIPFACKGNDQQSRVEFHVMRKALRDVVLGDPFLRMTETLSHFKSQITKTTRKKCWPQVCLVQGQHQGVLEILKGKPAEASPDTGSDIPVMSTKYARRKGLHFDESANNRIDVSLC